MRAAPEGSIVEYVEFDLGKEVALDLVDDLRIYDVCLSAEQVKALYEGRPPASQAQASTLPCLLSQ